MRVKNYQRLLIIVVSLGLAHVADAADYMCSPTPPDAKGPFYKPDAPIRNTIGTGYVLTGVVKSAKDCSPVANAKIEFWMTGPHGGYDDANRGTFYTNNSGAYKIESHYPSDYGFRPPHIHLQITADRFVTLVCQHYPGKGTEKGGFDIVLKPI